VRKFVAIGEWAVVGVGLALALLGALEIAIAFTGSQWLAKAKDYVDYAPLVGGIVGAVAGWVKKRST
jgi:hypothetical protein